MGSQSSNVIHSILASAALSDPVRSLIQRASSELAACENENIYAVTEDVVQSFARMQNADQAGWFSLSPAGELTQLYSSNICSAFLASALQRRLRSQPELRSRLLLSEGIILRRRGVSQVDADLLALARIGIGTCVLVPSSAPEENKTILVLASSSPQACWDEDILQQGTLLVNILSNAYQRKRTQQKMFESTHALQRLVMIAPSPMALINTGGSFISSNPAFLEAVGYTSDELSNVRCWSVFDNGQRRDTHSQRLSYSGEALQQRTRRIVRKDGTHLRARVVNLGQVDWPDCEGVLLAVTLEESARQSESELKLQQREQELSALAAQFLRSQESERRRISRELHDDIGQRLSLLASNAAFLTTMQSAPRAELETRLETIREGLDTVCSDIHTMSHNLHSYKLQHLGLRPTLKDLCRQISHTDVHVECHVDDFEEPCSAEVSLCLYRVAQEALTNAIRHGHASAIALTVARMGRVFYMTIQDSGIGFNSRVKHDGLGLVSMNERVRLANGEFSLYSHPGRGTEVWVSVPDANAIEEAQYVAECQ